MTANSGLCVSGRSVSPNNKPSVVSDERRGCAGGGGGGGRGGGGRAHLTVMTNGNGAGGTTGLGGGRGGRGGGGRLPCRRGRRPSVAKGNAARIQRKYQ
jgi:hypothetical protein